MPFKEIILFIIASIAALGILAGGIGYVISSFKKGGRQERSDVISSAETFAKFWQEQAEGYKSMMESKDIKYTDQINALSREVGELKGQLNAETQQKKEYLDILQNRDPETKKFMEFMVQATTTQAAINQEIIETLKEIHKMVLEERKKELHLDATLTKK